MGRIKQHLVSRGYNLRERANLYVGLALPTLALTSLAYFVGLDGKPYEDSFGITAAKLGISLLFNLPFVVPEFATGLALGFTSATQLRNERYLREQENKLEKEVAIDHKE